MQKLESIKTAVPSYRLEHICLSETVALRDSFSLAWVATPEQLSSVLSVQQRVSFPTGIL